MRKKEKKSQKVYSEREYHVYNGNDIPDIKVQESKIGDILARVRILENGIHILQKTVYQISEDYELAKHKKQIACMCCPLVKSK